MDAHILGRLSRIVTHNLTVLTLLVNDEDCCSIMLLAWFIDKYDQVCGVWHRKTLSIVLKTGIDRKCLITERVAFKVQVSLFAHGFFIFFAFVHNANNSDARSSLKPSSDTLDVLLVDVTVRKLGFEYTLEADPFYGSDPPYVSGRIFGQRVHWFFYYPPSAVPPFGQVGHYDSPTSLLTASNISIGTVVTFGPQTWIFGRTLHDLFSCTAWIMDSRFSDVDYSLFIYRLGTDIVYLLLYVDDIALTASSEKLLKHVIGWLHQEFSMIDLGSFNYFLGISVTRDSLGMFLSQKKYVVCSFLDRGASERVIVSTSPILWIRRSKLGDDCDPISDPTMYRSLAEAEYRACCYVVADAATCLVSNLLRELHTLLSSATLVYCDNCDFVLHCYFRSSVCAYLQQRLAVLALFLRCFRYSLMMPDVLQLKLQWGG
ncbi:ribonuclease H-like domain-containing protein [Tanacetum coccineum]